MRAAMLPQDRPGPVVRFLATLVVWVFIVPILWIRLRWMDLSIRWLRFDNRRLLRRLRGRMEQGQAVRIDRRECIRTLTNGARVYRVRLIGGPCDGASSICSGDTTYSHGQRYVRGADDLYYHTPEGAGRN